MVRWVHRSSSEASEVRVWFIVSWLQFELDVESRNSRRDSYHRVQVEFGYLREVFG